MVMILNGRHTQHDSWQDHHIATLPCRNQPVSLSNSSPSPYQQPSSTTIDKDINQDSTNKLCLEPSDMSLPWTPNDPNDSDSSNDNDNMSSNSSRISSKDDHRLPITRFQMITTTTTTTISNKLQFNSSLSTSALPSPTPLRIDSPLLESPRPPQPKPLRSLVIFSGGTACNSLVNVFQTISNDTTYILSVSDDGGSTSEVLRVLGGPALGDIRSRLTRLIDVEEGDGEKAAIKRLLSHRLPIMGDSKRIKEEWMDIVEGKHRLWNGIPTERKECIRAFLVHFQTEVLRSRKHFDFRNGSIGNFFLCGADQFFKSVESAIFLFCSITGIPSSTQIVPCINTQRSMTIAAQMDSGRVIRGQCAISHPSEFHERGVSFAPDRRTSLSFGYDIATNGTNVSYGSTSGSDSGYNSCCSPPFHTVTSPTDTSTPYPIITSNFPGIDLKRSENSSNSFTSHHHSSSQNGNLTYDKDVGRVSMTDRNGFPETISRLFYINEYGQEIFPDPNPKVLEALATKRALIFSIGSLYTSLIPSLILRQVGRAIATSPNLKYKILMLNSTHDRELPPPMTAVDVIKFIVEALDSSLRPHFPRSYPHEKYITHIVYVNGGEIQVPIKELSDMGIQSVKVKGRKEKSMIVFDEDDLYKTLLEIIKV